MRLHCGSFSGALQSTFAGPHSANTPKRRILKRKFCRVATIEFSPAVLRAVIYLSTPHPLNTRTLSSNATSCGAAVRVPAQREALRALGYAQQSVRSCGAAIDCIRSQCTNRREFSRRSAAPKVVGDCLPKARRLALGRSSVRCSAAGQSARLKAVEYSSRLRHYASKRPHTF
jgi:hypothetical protein